MLDRLMRPFDFHATALQLRAQRRQLIASNIANADTPQYQARDFNFNQALAQAQSSMLMEQDQRADAGRGGVGLQATRPGHFGGNSNSGKADGLARTEPGYRKPEQASIDGNTVDLDRERANFLDNSLRYESTLRFMNSNIRQMITAIKGE